MQAALFTYLFDLWQKEMRQIYIQNRVQNGWHKTRKTEDGTSGEKSWAQSFLVCLFFVMVWKRRKRGKEKVKQNSTQPLHNILYKEVYYNSETIQNKVLQNYEKRIPIWQKFGFYVFVVLLIFFLRFFGASRIAVSYWFSLYVGPNFSFFVLFE